MIPRILLGNFQKVLSSSFVEGSRFFSSKPRQTIESVAKPRLKKTPHLSAAPPLKGRVIVEKQRIPSVQEINNSPALLAELDKMYTAMSTDPEYIEVTKFCMAMFKQNFGKKK